MSRRAFFDRDFLSSGVLPQGHCASGLEIPDRIEEFGVDCTLPTAPPVIVEADDVPPPPPSIFEPCYMPIMEMKWNNTTDTSDWNNPYDFHGLHRRYDAHSFQWDDPLNMPNREAIITDDSLGFEIIPVDGDPCHPRINLHLRASRHFFKVNETTVFTGVPEASISMTPRSNISFTDEIVFFNPDNVDKEIQEVDLYYKTELLQRDYGISCINAPIDAPYEYTYYVKDNTRKEEEVLGIRSGEGSPSTLVSFSRLWRGFSCIFRNCRSDGTSIFSDDAYHTRLFGTDTVQFDQNFTASVSTVPAPSIMNIRSAFLTTITMNARLQSGMQVSIITRDNVYIEPRLSVFSANENKYPVVPSSFKEFEEDIIEDRNVGRIVYGDTFNVSPCAAGFMVLNGEENIDEFTIIGGPYVFRVRRQKKGRIPDIHVGFPDVTNPTMLAWLSWIITIRMHAVYSDIAKGTTADPISRLADTVGMISSVLNDMKDELPASTADKIEKLSTATEQTRKEIDAWIDDHYALDQMPTVEELERVYVGMHDAQHAAAIALGRPYSRPNDTSISSK